MSAHTRQVTQGVVHKVTHRFTNVLAQIEGVELLHEGILLALRQVTLQQTVNVQ